MRFLTLKKSLSMGLILTIFYMVICGGFVDASSSTFNSERNNNNQSRILQYRTLNENPKTAHRLAGSKVNKSSIACDFKCSTRLKRRKINSMTTAPIRMDGSTDNITTNEMKTTMKTTTVQPLVNTSGTERTDTLLNNNNTHKHDTTSFSDSDLTEKLPNLKDLFKKVRDSRKQCKLKQSKSKSFHCQRLRWAWWIVQELEKKKTKLNDFVELVYRNESDVFDLNESQLLPESGLEKRIYNLVLKWGEPMDQLVFLEAKKYAKSRELKVTIPSLAEIKIGPKTHTSLQTGRIFFDPGFNFKMKIPFFRDEMKFAVSTGPSFIAGLGLGMVMLGIKSMFSPMMFAMKAMMWSYFMKDTSPFDLLKWTFGFGGSNDEHVEEVQHVEVYDPPQVHNPYDNVLDKHATGASGNSNNNNNNYNTLGLTSFGNNLNYNNNNHQNNHQYHNVGGGYDLGQNSNNLQNQYGINPNRINPILPQLVQSISTGLTGPSGPSSYNQLGPTAHIMNLLRARQRPSTTGTSGSSGATSSFSGASNLDNYKRTTEAPETGFKYVPSAALQLEVEHFDPFYSPLLSRIDSIFMHLGFTEEGCKERAVCSIYKFPVKYAPYSNLLSAQLSKHQSELKRPVSTSPKILRYFKYMKAAKDGQGALNCLELYPKCTNDTEKLSSLPMVKTYQTLTELMGTGSG